MLALSIIYDVGITNNICIRLAQIWSPYCRIAFRMTPFWCIPPPYSEDGDVDGELNYLECEQSSGYLIFNKEVGKL